ncbi:MAG TPA: MFS transporter [Rhizomicrobium sp.]|nr:MFS transporter [Rhizomicrobium sp.]
MPLSQAAPQRMPAEYSVRLKWGIVVLLAVASVIAYVDRVNISIAIIDPGFKAFFQLDNSDRGLIGSAFFWTYAALQIPAGWIVDRYGSKYPIAIAFTVWSLLTAATAFTTGFYTLFAIRLLLGLGEAVIHPGSMRWIRYHFPERRRGLAIGLFMSGSKFGPAIGAVAAAWLIERYNWQAMFLIMGFGALIWLIPWLLCVRNDSEKHAAIAQAAKAEPEISTRQLLASPILWGTVIGTFSYMYFVYFCLTWIPAYLNEARGLSLASSSLYTTFSFAGMAVVAILGGLAADSLIARKYDAVKVRKAFTIAGFLIAATGPMGGMAESLNTALIFSVISLSGLGLATANYWALTQTLLPSKSIGRMVGIQNCAANVAGIVAPILTGRLIESTGSYDAPMQAILVFLALGICAYLFLVREKYSHKPI